MPFDAYETIDTERGIYLLRHREHDYYTVVFVDRDRQSHPVHANPIEGEDTLWAWVEHDVFAHPTSAGVEYIGDRLDEAEARGTYDALVRQWRELDAW